MSKIDSAQRRPRLADAPPQVGVAQPVPPVRSMAIPGGRSYERSDAGGEDRTPPPPPTPMPIPGGRSYDPPEAGGEDQTPPPPLPPPDMPIRGR